MTTVLRNAFAALLIGSAIAPAMAEPTYTAEDLRMVSPRIRDQIIIQPHAEEHVVTFGMSGLQQDGLASQSLPVSPRISSKITSGFSYSAGAGSSAGMAASGLHADCEGVSPRISGPGFNNC